MDHGTWTWDAGHGTWDPSQETHRDQTPAVPNGRWLVGLPAQWPTCLGSVRRSSPRPKSHVPFPHLPLAGARGMLLCFARAASRAWLDRPGRPRGLRADARRVRQESQAWSNCVSSVSVGDIAPSTVFAPWISGRRGTAVPSRNWDGTTRSKRRPRRPCRSTWIARGTGSASGPSLPARWPRS